jgi:hypothetical protein
MIVTMPQKKNRRIRSPPIQSGADGNRPNTTDRAPSGASTISGTSRMRTTRLECLPGMQATYHRTYLLFATEAAVFNDSPRESTCMRITCH